MLKAKAEPGRLLSVSEVAVLRGVTRPGVLGAIRDGRLPAERVGVGVTWVWAIREADAEAWTPRAYRRTPRGPDGGVLRRPRVKVLAEPA
jgi:excisionase family DNA binding protein